MGTRANALDAGRCDAHTWAADVVAAPPGRAHPSSPAAQAQAQAPAQAGRNVVERTFSWLDKSRKLLLRYDQKISAYADWTYLACLRMVGARLA